QVTWASATPAVAPIANAAGVQGLATALAVGTTSITAALGRVVSPADTLTVSPAALVSIAVSPTNPAIVKGLTQSFSATGTYTDGSTQDLAGQVSWASGAPAVATIDPASGLASTVATGTSAITATLGS